MQGQGGGVYLAFLPFIGHFFGPLVAYQVFSKLYFGKKNRHGLLLGLKLRLSGICYGVMQSDGNSISGDVVLDFNRAYFDEFNISDQIYKDKYVRIIFMMSLVLYNILQKCLLTQQ